MSGGVDVGVNRQVGVFDLDIQEGFRDAVAERYHWATLSRLLQNSQDIRMRRAAAEDEREATEDGGAAERPVAAASCARIQRRGRRVPRARRP